MTPEVPKSIVDAAVKAARRREESLAKIPLTAVAKAAGISRSTLLRRLGGKRSALDAAIVAHGIDLGRKPDVRERAIAAAAKLMNEHGLEAATLDAVATEAQCSVPSLHVIFGTRDGLLTAVFNRHGPLGELEALAANSSDGPEECVRAICRAFIAAFEREPRVLPALFADLLSRPEGPASRLLKAKMPRAMRSIEALLGSQMTAGRSLGLPPTLIIELLLGPLFFHALFTPRISSGDRNGEPSADEFADKLTRSFLCAVSKRKP